MSLYEILEKKNEILEKRFPQIVNQKFDQMKVPSSHLLSLGNIVELHTKILIFYCTWFARALNSP